MAANESTKRPRKSASEKAVIDLEAAIKTRDLAEKKRDKLREGLQPAEDAYSKAEARVQFLLLNPDLPEEYRESDEAVANDFADDEESDADSTPALAEV